MKRRDLDDLRSLSIGELKTNLRETRKAIAKTTLEVAMRKHTNVHAAQILRKKSAVIQTLIKEKQLTA